jgi:hypothetical protein
MATTSKRNGDTMLMQGELIVVSCWCGIKHAVPSALYHHAKESSKNEIYCPLGHIFVYRDSDASALRKEKAVLERQLANALARERREQERRQATERTNRALKGHLTRWKRRVSNGVCPVAGCKRHFPNVAEHVKTCHGDWLKEHPEVFET